MQGMMQYLQSMLSPGQAFVNQVPQYNNQGLPLDYNYAAYTQNAPLTMGAGEGGMHWPDTYKLPAHQTFSNESQYANPMAGSWYQPKPIGAHNVAMYKPSPQGMLTGHIPTMEQWRGQ